MLEKFGIHYDLMLLNIARKFGLESEQVFKFVEVVNNSKSNEEIQNGYSEIMGVK